MKKASIISFFIACLILATVGDSNTVSAQNTVEDRYWEMVKDSKNVSDLKQYLKEYPEGKYSPIARLKIKRLSPFQNKSGMNFILTPTSVGDLHLGMTVAEARKVFKNAKFEQYNYTEEGTWVEVKEDTKILLRFSTDQKDNTKLDEKSGRVPINESAKIEKIEFEDARYKTVDGIGIGTPVTEAAKKFGKITKIELWEYDGSEHAEFANAPKNYSFVIDSPKGSTADSKAGIYGKGKFSTKRFKPDSFISSIKISVAENKGISNNVAPKFENYPAQVIFTGKNSSLILDEFGKMYRTRLSYALKNGKPNFAGKYIVTGWGCGSGGCNTGAIIDAQTGRAYSFPVSMSSVTQYNSDGEAIADFQDQKYKLNSRLMMFAGNLMGSEHTDGNDVIEYYEFKDGQFIFVKSMPYGKSK